MSLARSHPSASPLAARRVCIIGLDCVPPALVWERYAGRLPTLDSLRGSGWYGGLTSTLPPITVPAWAAMFTGVDPGRLGIYGFRNRTAPTYGEPSLADATWLQWPALWDLVGRAGGRSIVLGVPLTYPPRPMDGLMVAGPLTPDKRAAYTYPRWLKLRLDEWAGGEYLIDAPDFRTEDKARLLGDLHRMTQARFTLARRLIHEDDWDLFMMVEMGPDRLHHAFWRHGDPDHPGHDPAGHWRRAMLEYYQALDAHLGALVAELPPETLVLVVSDHGAQAMQGGLAINQWLVEQGWLALKDPAASGPLTPAMVDWPRTRAWAEGGYYARVMVNLAGREPEGLVTLAELPGFLGELRSRLEALPGPDGAPLGNQALLPGEIYPEARGLPPDLILLPGGLRWRALASLGHESIYCPNNDTGPDEANHAMEGIVLAAVTCRALPAPAAGRRLARPASIYDIAPTVLAALGIAPPEQMGGVVLGAG